jgi:hypothetical protein
MRGLKRSLGVGLISVLMGASGGAQSKHPHDIDTFEYWSRYRLLPGIVASIDDKGMSIRSTDRYGKSITTVFTFETGVTQFSHGPVKRNDPVIVSYCGEDFLAFVVSWTGKKDKRETV